MASTIFNRNGYHNSNLDDGKCYVCKTFCTNRCSRCGELYCSIKCQKEDWRKHKYICFEMPTLFMGPPVSNVRENNRTSASTEHLSVKSSSSSSLTLQSESKPKIVWGDLPENNDDVILTKVVKPNTYYIRTFASSIDYNKNCIDFNEQGENGIKLLQTPNKNDVILVRYNGKFTRGVVTNTYDRENIEVFLADIGGKTHKPLSDFRVISDDLLKRKRHTFQIVLNNLGYIGEGEFKNLLNFVREKAIFRLQFNGESFTSENNNFSLFEKSSGLPIDALLSPQSVAKSSQLSTAFEPLKSTKPYQTKDHLETKERKDVDPQKSEVIPPPKLTSSKKIYIYDLVMETLPEGVTDLAVLDSSTIVVGCISVTTMENVDKLGKLHTKVQEIAKHLTEEYEPEDNEVCLAKSADYQEWYRAQFIKEQGEFHFIDYGNYEKVPRKNLRQLPESLLDPCYTVYCYIDKFPEKMFRKHAENLKRLLSDDNNRRHNGCEVKKVYKENEVKIYVTLKLIFDYLLQAN